MRATAPADGAGGTACLGPNSSVCKPRYQSCSPCASGRGASGVRTVLPEAAGHQTACDPAGELGGLCPRVTLPWLPAWRKSCWGEKTGEGGSGPQQSAHDDCCFSSRWQPSGQEVARLRSANVPQLETSTAGGVVGWALGPSSQTWWAARPGDTWCEAEHSLQVCSQCLHARLGDSAQHGSLCASESPHS